MAPRAAAGDGTVPRSVAEVAPRVVAFGVGAAGTADEFAARAWPTDPGDEMPLDGRHRTCWAAGALVPWVAGTREVAVTGVSRVAGAVDAEAEVVAVLVEAAEPAPHGGDTGALVSVADGAAEVDTELGADCADDGATGDGRGSGAGSGAGCAEPEPVTGPGWGGGGAGVVSDRGAGARGGGSGGGAP